MLIKVFTPKLLNRVPPSGSTFETFAKLKKALRPLIGDGLYAQRGLGAGWSSLDREIRESAGMFIIQSSRGHTCALAVDHPTMGSFAIDPASGSSFPLKTKELASLQAALKKCGVDSVRTAARVRARARKGGDADGPWSWRAGSRPCAPAAAAAGAHSKKRKLL